MKKSTYDELRARLTGKTGSRSRYSKTVVPEGTPDISVIAVKGRSAGTLGVLVEVGYTDKGEDRIAFIAADGTEVDLSYKQVEFADQNGDPIIDEVTDTLGQTVEEGQFVAYSTTGTYGESHGLAIGKVVKVTEAGSLVVRPILKSGTKARPSSYRKETTTVKTPRALRLPVDQTLMAMHVLSDFDEFEKKE